uniref:Small integral membrane protein 33 n=1 Tax=Calidris pygmaea TaxID=425635 RepID=A0A8C3J1H1_9CHAR
EAAAAGYPLPGEVTLGGLDLGVQPGQGRCHTVPVVFLPRKSDALPVISVIVVIFVLLAVFIILVVHYGPQLRTVQITLYHEPMPQDMDNGVHLTDWKKLGSQKKPPAQPCQQEPGGVDAASMSCQCSCRHHLPLGSAEPNVIEITYL